MSGDATYNPGPLDFPDCWTVGNTIGPIVTTYDGPTLDGSTIKLSFSNGQVITASFVEDFSVEYPTRHIITFDEYEPEPLLAGETSVSYDYTITYGVAAAPTVERTIHAGVWNPVDRKVP